MQNFLSICLGVRTEVPLLVNQIFEVEVSLHTVTREFCQMCKWYPNRIEIYIVVNICVQNQWNVVDYDFVTPHAELWQLAELQI